MGNPKPKHFTVKWADGSAALFDAEEYRFSVQGGSLLIFRFDQLVEAYGPGVWESVEAPLV